MPLRGYTSWTQVTRTTTRTTSRTDASFQPSLPSDFKLQNSLPSAQLAFSPASLQHSNLQNGLLSDSKPSAQLALSPQSLDWIALSLQASSRVCSQHSSLQQGLISDSQPSAWLAFLRLQVSAQHAPSPSTEASSTMATMVITHQCLVHKRVPCSPVKAG